MESSRTCLGSSWVAACLVVCIIKELDVREIPNGTNVGFFPPDNFFCLSLVLNSVFWICCKSWSERISLQSVMHLSEEIISDIRALVFLVYFRNPAPTNAIFCISLICLFVQRSDSALSILACKGNSSKWKETQENETEQKPMGFFHFDSLIFYFCVLSSLQTLLMPLWLAQNNPALPPIHAKMAVSWDICCGAWSLAMQSNPICGE